VPITYHYYAWHHDLGSQSIDCYPHFFPARPGFEEAVARMEAVGVRVMPYLNARLWRTDIESWQQGQSAAVRDPYGRIHEEVWMKIPAAVMSPATELWRSTIGDQAVKLSEIGCSGVYLDQLGASLTLQWYKWSKPVDVTLPQVLASAWKASSGQSGVLLVNIGDEAATIALDSRNATGAQATLARIGADGQVADRNRGPCRRGLRAHALRPISRSASRVTRCPSATRSGCCRVRARGTTSGWRLPPTAC